ncbi:hypothetical protein KR084_009587, partial [Drosophila pseudotakahashii]
QTEPAPKHRPAEPIAQENVGTGNRPKEKAILSKRREISTVAKQPDGNPIPSRSRPDAWQKAEPRKRARKNRRPEAVVIEANGKSYSEVLAMVTRRSDGKLQDLSESVNKVRRTASGNLLLELSRGSNSSAVMMKKDLESVLEGAAAVRALSEDTRVQFLVVSDL